MWLLGWTSDSVSSTPSLASPLSTERAALYSLHPVPDPERAGDRGPSRDSTQPRPVARPQVLPWTLCWPSGEAALCGREL